MPILIIGAIGLGGYLLYKQQQEEAVKQQLAQTQAITQQVIATAEQAMAQGPDPSASGGSSFISNVPVIGDIWDAVF